MTIYVAFLAYILICALIIYSQSGDSVRKNRLFLNFVFVALFLLYSLRASSVGRDLPGYERAYGFANVDLFTGLRFGNFEKGYLFLMWICNKLNLSFQWFLTICNVIILIPIYRYIRKYSQNAFLSVILYICYIYFEFNLTGIRQAIATSIVLIAIMVLNEFNRRRVGLLIYCLIVLLASLFHTGALVALFYVPFHFMRKFKNYALSMILMAVTILVARGYIMEFIKNFFKQDSMNASAGLYIGLNLLFLIGLAVLFIIGGKNREIKENNIVEENISVANNGDSMQIIMEKMFYLSIVVLFLFGSDTAVRSYLILNQVIIVLLPNSLQYIFDKKSQRIVAVFFAVFFLIFFFINTLIPNNFDIVPYKFFWN
ncbi:TPA: EpsG family protein [Streptococcus suis]|uniref:EpsG family protein n=1 Tax=Streptococcus suis TaxID=1307 RepID=UPI002AA4B7B9|nr:EpsG family protein [Streptococcus suis]HEP1836819.1 EpsG family protein [Streptococcus suis]